MFTRSGSTWSQQGGKLTGTGAIGSPWFGYTVALSGDGNTALIGGWLDDGWKGAAWVFTRSGSTWTQQGEKLTAQRMRIGEGMFGTNVTLSADGNTALIGGWNDDSEFGGNRDYSGKGAAWVFTRSGSTWTQQGPKLTANDETGNGKFGTIVALSANGDTALIGGWNDDHSKGAAWVFTRSGSTWTQQGPKLTGAGETGEGRFGVAVALSADGDTALVGGLCRQRHQRRGLAVHPLGLHLDPAGPKADPQRRGRRKRIRHERRALRRRRHGADRRLARQRRHGCGVGLRGSAHRDVGCGDEHRARPARPSTEPSVPEARARRTSSTGRPRPTGPRPPSRALAPPAARVHSRPQSAGLRRE